MQGSEYAAITANNVLYEVRLPTRFRLHFDVSVPGLANINEYRNILDLRDTSTGASLLKMYITETNNIRLEYGGIPYYLAGPPMATPYSVFTTFDIWVLHGSISVLSSADEDSTDVHAISGPEIVTEASSYYLLASSSNDITSGGYLMNFAITGI